MGRSVHVNQSGVFFFFVFLVLAMGLVKGGSYGTFEGQEGFPQPSAPSLAGTYSSGGQQQFASYAIPGMYAMVIPPALSSASQILRLRIAEVKGVFRSWETLVIS